MADTQNINNPLRNSGQNGAQNGAPQTPASSVVVYDFSLNEQYRAERLERARKFAEQSVPRIDSVPIEGDSPEDSIDADSIDQAALEHHPGNDTKKKAKHLKSGKSSAKSTLSETNILQMANGLGKKQGNGLFLIIAAAIVCALVVVIIAVVMTLKPINITVNGQDISLGGEKNVASTVKAANLSPRAGNLVTVNGSIIERGAGEAFSATVNGETADPLAGLNDGDVVVISNGGDIEEESYPREDFIEYGAIVDGVGAVHKIESEGTKGTQLMKVGLISGETAPVEMLEDPADVNVSRFNINTNGEKVIALTFDDGPHSDYTGAVLDILAANDAKGTFFTIGDRITDSTKPLIARAYNEGHQVSTHSYDHASGSGQGVNLGYMSAEEQVEEILKGYEAIENATGAEASKVIRTPGGNFGENVIVNLSPYITHEIGWNVDTNDWQRPGTSVIEQRILQAGPGDIILMHDGGGDRSQTVEALRRALPTLAAQGYRFVTVDELLEYVD